MGEISESGGGIDRERERDIQIAKKRTEMGKAVALLCFALLILNKITNCICIHVPKCIYIFNSFIYALLVFSFTLFIIQ